MKKLLLLFASFLTLGQTAFAYDTWATAPSGQPLYYNISNGNAVVTYPGSSSTSPYYDRMRGYSYSRPNGNLIIPDSVTYNGRTYAVARIGNYAFIGCTGLTSVSISNSVTNIGYNAFYGCSSLTAVTIPSSVTGIGNYAFYSSTSLSIVTIPDSVTYIGSYAFSGCIGLTSIIIGNSVNSIYDHAFESCTGLTSVTIPNSVSYINAGAFMDCTSLDTVYLMNPTPPMLGNGAFTGNAPGRVFILSGCSYDNYYNCNYNNYWYLFRDDFRNPIIDINVNVRSSNSTRGTASVVLGPDNRIVRCDSTVVVEATAYSNYRFDHWSTGSTANPDTNTLTGDCTITAYFIPIQYTINATSANPAIGTVTGGGTYNGGTTATLTATPNTGYHFVQWQDGNTQNPRTVTVTGNATYTATFAANAAPASVTATISQIASTSAHIDIVMGQNTSYFIFMYGLQSVFVQNGLTTDEAILNYVNNNYDSSDRNYNNVSGYMNNLTPNTAYRVVVVPYNSNNVAGTIIMEQFTTLTTNGIESLDEETYTVSSHDGCLTVSGSNGENVYLYNLDGQCIYFARATGTTMIDVPSPGTYLVKVGNYPARKVVVIK